MILPAVPAFGGENISSVVRTLAPAKDFATYLPALPPHAPWQSLDARTKLPKGDFPLGRDTDDIGDVVLPSPPTQVPNEGAGAIVERRM
jgi:hypothetical protein